MVLEGLNELESVSVNSCEVDPENVCDMELDPDELCVSVPAELLTSDEVVMDDDGLNVCDGDTEDDGVREMVPGVMYWVSDRVVVKEGVFDSVGSFVDVNEPDQVQLNDIEFDVLMEPREGLRTNVWLGDRLSDVENFEREFSSDCEALGSWVSDGVIDTDFDTVPSRLLVRDDEDDDVTVVLREVLNVLDVDIVRLIESSYVRDMLDVVEVLWDGDPVRERDEDRLCDELTVMVTSGVSEPGDDDKELDVDFVFDEGADVVWEGDGERELLKGRYFVGVAENSEDVDGVDESVVVGDPVTLCTPDADFVTDDVSVVVGDAMPPTSLALVRLRDRLAVTLFVTSCDCDCVGVPRETDKINVKEELFVTVRDTLAVRLGEAVVVSVSVSRVIEITCVATDCDGVDDLRESLRSRDNVTDEVYEGDDDCDEVVLLEGSNEADNDVD